MLNKDQENGYVNQVNKDGITTIEFFHPQSNSLPAILLKKLTQAIENAGEDDAAKLIVLKSGGEKVFCAGASFEELAAIKNEVEGIAFFSGFAYLINAMRHCPKLIIGSIYGRCVGGGVGIAAACDYAIALRGADIKLSELTIGIGPFVIGPAVQRKIGLAAFGELAINAAEWQSSEWACSKGLYVSVHDSINAMDETINKLATTLSHSNPDAMAAIKKMLWQGTAHWDVLLLERAAISGKLVLSDHTKNAIISFKAKQK